MTQSGNTVTDTVNLALASGRSTTDIAFDNIGVTWRSAGTSKNLFTRVVSNATTAPSTLKESNNNVTGNLSISIGTGATGDFEDTTNQDIITSSANNRDYLLTLGSSSSVQFGAVSSQFDHATDSVKRFVNVGGDQVIATNTTRYFGIVGTMNPQSTETNTHARMKASGNWKNGFIEISANTIASASTAVTRKNATTDGTCSISITASTSGNFENTANSDPVVTGDDWNWRVTTPNVAGNLTVNRLALDWDATNGFSPFILVEDGGASQATNLTRNYTMDGRVGSTFATEVNAKTKCRFTFTAQNLNARVLTNTYSAATSVTVRKTQAATALALSIGATTTGVIVDDSDTVSFANGNEMSYQIVTPNVAGTITFISIVSFASTPTGSTVQVRFPTQSFYNGLGMNSNPMGLFIRR